MTTTRSTRNVPSYISLFSGAGGLDIGLEMAGWKTAYASDNDPFAVDTLKANVGHRLRRGLNAFDGTFIENADITTVDPQSILQKSGLTRGNVQLIAGGPPCQSWSSAGHQLGFADPRGRLFHDFIRVANALDARWILLENVRGLLTARGPDGQPGSALNQIRSDLLNAGFQTTVSLLNAADFGVAQRRVRLFMVGFRVGDVPPFPQATHSKAPGFEGSHSWVTLGDAIKTIGDLSPAEIFRPAGKMAEDLRDILPGRGVKSPGKAERTRPNGHWGYKQGAFVADPSQSARTVTAGAQQDWIRDPVHGLRRLAPRECAAIQSFPLSWKFEGNLQAQYRLIGNAVPPLLGAAIGESMRSHSNFEASSAIANFDSLLPLPDRLAYHVRYTQREEKSNGQSRREGPKRRKLRTA